jgi:hypothetical protein
MTKCKTNFATRESGVHVTEFKTKTRYGYCTSCTSGDVDYEKTAEITMGQSKLRICPQCANDLVRELKGKL